MTKIIIYLTFFICYSAVNSANSAPVFDKKQLTDQSAVIVTRDNGEIIHAWNTRKSLIPASVVKIATSLAAIERFGLDHQFKTDFFIVDDGLWVKGYGDPYLTSEELDVIAEELVIRLADQLEKIRFIGIDDSYFPPLKVPGRSISTQPYDAPLSAVSANFNTVKIRKKGTTIVSAEPQTPITPLAKSLALSKRLNNGVHRINLIKTENSSRYFAELLFAKLKRYGFSNRVSTKTGIVPNQAKLVYQHINSHTLEDALRATLFFSNNFIANQVFLQMNDDQVSTSFEQAANYVGHLLSLELTRQDNDLARIVEGSGLSRENRLTAEQVVALLKRFEPYKYLMKTYLGGKVFAKSGTLKGVHNLAGYIQKSNQTYYFAFIFNESVAYGYREKLLKRLYATL